MLTTKLAKELIAFRLEEKGITNSRWCKVYADDTFYSNTKEINLLPKPVGSHHQPVYNNFGTRCNTICVNHFAKDNCLFMDKYLAIRIYLCCGASKYSEEQEEKEANKHLGEIYVAFERFVSEGNGEISSNDNGIDLTLDELEQRDPEFLKNLIFNLK